MKEFVALVGGRNVYKEDWQNLQDLSLAFSSIFSGCNDFVISGCAITGAVGNKTISEGFIWMNGKIRKFAGKTGVALESNNYLVETMTIESVTYSGGGTKEGRRNYGVEWTGVLPVGKSYITIPSSGVLPRINDELFGKYAILSNPSRSRQTINQLLQLNDALSVAGEVNVGGGSSRSDLILNRTTTAGILAQTIHTISSGGVGGIQHLYNGIRAGQVIFDPVQGYFAIQIGDEDQIIITKGGVRVKSIVSDGSITNGHITVSGQSINRSSGDVDGGSIDINYTGLGGGTSRFRDTCIYDGKNSLISRFIGAQRMQEIYGKLSVVGDDDSAFILKHSTRTFGDNAYKKSIQWQDKNGAPMLEVGYKSDANNTATIDNFSIGDIEIKPRSELKVTTPISEAGVLLSAKYAGISALTSGLSGKVDKVAGKQLSDQNYTLPEKNKLDSIGTAASVAIGETKYTTGEQVFNATTGKLIASSNLSDVPDKAAARASLSVYSQAQSDLKYTTKTANLSDLADKDAARANLSAAKIGDSYLKAEVYKKDEVFTKAESDLTYQKALIDTGWLNADNPNGTRNLNIKVRRYGNVVNIIGTFGTSGLWYPQIVFAIPAPIPPPPFGTGAVVSSRVSGDDNNGGVVIKCDGDSRNFTVFDHKPHTDTVWVNLTYLV